MDTNLFMMAYSFGRELDDRLAANFVTLDSPSITEEATGKTYGPYTLTVSRKAAKSPAQRITELEAEVAQLRLEARRFYNADGSFVTLASPEAVIAKRIESARFIKSIADSLTTLAD